jgi:hypothetical protein
MSRFSAPLLFGSMLALNVTAVFVDLWELSAVALAISVVWLVYLLERYDFPWPWRRR